MSPAFRNVDGSTTDDVRTWPYEGVVAVVERGLIDEWRPLFAEIRRSPWGEVARRVEQILTHRERDGVSRLFELVLGTARASVEELDRTEVVRRLRAAVSRSGLTDARFAREVGTSASRLSTYLAGKVTPSAAMLVRIERAASHLAHGTPQLT